MRFITYESSNGWKTWLPGNNRKKGEEDEEHGESSETCSGEEGCGEYWKYNKESEASVDNGGDWSDAKYPQLGSEETVIMEDYKMIPFTLRGVLWKDCAQASFHRIMITWALHWAGFEQFWNG